MAFPGQRWEALSSLLEQESKSCFKAETWLCRTPCIWAKFSWG